MERNKEFIGNAKMEELTDEEMKAVAGGSDYKLRVTLSEEQIKIIEDKKNRPVVWKTEA